MSVLITGGAGYIGSHMAWLLEEEARDYVIVDNLTTGSLGAVPDAAKLIRGDVGDIAFMTGLLRERAITTIIHFAGSILVPESMSNPLKYYDNNTARTAALLRAAVEAGVGQFVFSSTAAVYGDPGTDLVREDRPLTPISPYGRSKLMSEWALGDVAAAHGLRFAALRYFNVAGADPQARTGQNANNTTHLIRTAVRAALGRVPGLSIYGTDYPTADGTAMRDFVHVSDLVLAHLSALRHLEAGGQGGIFNCGYGRGFSVREVITMVEQVSGRRLTLTEAPRRPGDAPQVIADVGKIKAALDWRPRHDTLEEIIRTSYVWESKAETD